MFSSDHDQPECESENPDSALRAERRLHRKGQVALPLNASIFEGRVGVAKLIDRLAQESADGYIPVHTAILHIGSCPRGVVDFESLARCIYEGHSILRGDALPYVLLTDEARTPWRGYAEEAIAILQRHGFELTVTGVDMASEKVKPEFFGAHVSDIEWNTDWAAEAAKCTW